MRHGIVSLGLAALVVGVYWGIWSFAFVDFDDNVYLLDNPHVRDGLTVESTTWALTTGYHSNWHPLTWLSYLAEIEVFGLNAGVMHVTNVLLHGLNGILLYLLLWRATGAEWRSLLVAALFAVHPLHVEAVAWVSERKEVLGTLFALLAFHAYISYTGKKTAGYYGLTAACFALSLMAKPMWVTLPVLLLLFDTWPLQRSEPWAVRVREKLPLFALAVAAGLVTLAVQGGAKSVQSLETIPFAQRVGNAVLAYSLYLVKTVWPSDLAVFYPHPREELRWWAVGCSAVILVTITAVLFRWRRRVPAMWMGWAWFVVALTPVIGVVQVGGQAMADRYTYVAHIGLFAGIVWLVPLVARWTFARPAPFAAAASVVVLLGIQAAGQVRYWRDTETLFARTVAVTDDNVLAHAVLSRYYFDLGQLPAAEGHARSAVAINAEYAGGWRELGLLLFAQDRPREAQFALERMLTLEPDSATAHFYLAKALAAQGDFAGAAESFVAALALDRDNAVIRTAYGNFLARRALEGHGPGLEAAIEQLTKAVEADPDYALAHLNLGRALGLLGREHEAQRHLAAAERLQIPAARRAQSSAKDH